MPAQNAKARHFADLLRHMARKSCKPLWLDRQQLSRQSIAPQITPPYEVHEVPCPNLDTSNDDALSDLPTSLVDPAVAGVEAPSKYDKVHDALRVERPPTPTTGLQTSSRVTSLYSLTVSTSFYASGLPDLQSGSSSSEIPHGRFWETESEDYNWSSDCRWYSMGFTLLQIYGLTPKSILKSRIQCQRHQHQQDNTNDLRSSTVTNSPGHCSFNEISVHKHDQMVQGLKHGKTIPRMIAQAVLQTDEPLDRHYLINAIIMSTIKSDPKTQINNRIPARLRCHCARRICCI